MSGTFFGIIISGRPILIEAETIPPNKVVFSIPTTPAFGNIVVFLLPGQPLPDGFAASIYLQGYPKATDAQFLGAIGNGKPSAIFKVNKPEGAQPLENAVLGISIDPEQEVAAVLSEKGMKTSFTYGSGTALQAAPSQATTKNLAKAIIQNAYNFLSGFSGNFVNGIEVVPLKAFNEWWTKFERRVDQDPSFLERPQD